eukprot:scaffold61898_cov72-Phaeocystis_antarctica.AAC.8
MSTNTPDPYACRVKRMMLQAEGGWWNGGTPRLRSSTSPGWSLLRPSHHGPAGAPCCQLQAEMSRAIERRPRPAAVATTGAALAAAIAAAATAAAAAAAAAPTCCFYYVA